MRAILNPGTLLLFLVACIVAACAYFEQYGYSPTHTGRGICGGFLVLGGFALFGAVYLHVHEKRE
jgi:hypothetical protein